ncbi:MAG: hypothetical protein K2M19_07100 [Muribaculaceae bacterium]|nr:hypothetical protein [Muribaculaceae bacterium]
MNNTAITLRPLWINHIERFSERMRPRLYGALIAFLLHGTPIPEKMLPYLGIILDLIEAEGDQVAGNKSGDSNQAETTANSASDVLPEATAGHGNTPLSCAHVTLPRISVHPEITVTLPQLHHEPQKDYGTDTLLRPVYTDNVS